jgi:hypothetical protein
MKCCPTVELLLSSPACDSLGFEDHFALQTTGSGPAISAHQFGLVWTHPPAMMHRCLRQCKVVVACVPGVLQGHIGFAAAYMEMATLIGGKKKNHQSHDFDPEFQGTILHAASCHNTTKVAVVSQRRSLYTSRTVNPPLMSILKTWHRGTNSQTFLRLQE